MRGVAMEPCGPRTEMANEPGANWSDGTDGKWQAKEQEGLVMVMLSICGVWTVFVHVGWVGSCA